MIGANDAPELGGIAPGPQATDDDSTLTPFSAATLEDIDGPGVPLTVTVSLDDAAKGSLTNLGGFNRSGRRLLCLQRQPGRCRDRAARPRLHAGGEPRRTGRYRNNDTHRAGE